MAARDLVSDDPYATAVRLLQAGALLRLHQAAELVQALPHHARVSFAGYALTDDTAAQAIDGFMRMPADVLESNGMHHLADAIRASDPERWGR